MTAYYNEIDPFAAAWLRELIKAGHIAPGDVDERSIEDVRPIELAGYTQCHFFAGIGGWSLAARLAGIPDDYPLWTGSCPCQPYSDAGARAGDDDPRALWWAFRWLIKQCSPSVVAGEQVASPAGRRWLSGVRADLETLGYAVGGADLCSAGVGAPNIRPRLYWVGHADNKGPQGRRESIGKRNQEGRQASERHGAQAGFWSSFEVVTDIHGKRRRIEPGAKPLAYGIPKRVGKLRGYGNAINPQLGAQFLSAYLEATA